MNNNIEYDKCILKEKSRALKFIAVVLMIILHTFAFPERIEGVNFISIWNIGERAIEYKLSKFGEICIGMFIFLSGYGLYIQYGENIKVQYIFQRLLKLYMNYWVVIAIFIPIGQYMGKYKIEMKSFLLTITGIKPSYNGEWWFITLYIMLLIVYPLLVKILEKYNIILVGGVSFVINVIGFVITKLVYIIGSTGILTHLVSILLGGQFLFVMGMMVAKYRLFDALKNRLDINRKYYILIAIILSFIILFMIHIPIIGEISKLILIPVFIFVVGNLLSEKTWLNILGKHSTNIWLVHSFFCYYLFQELAFLPKYSILIIIWIYILSIGCSFGINLIIRCLDVIIEKFIPNCLRQIS